MTRKEAKTELKRVPGWMVNGRFMKRPKPAKVQYERGLPPAGAVIVPDAGTLFETVHVINGMVIERHPKTGAVRLRPEHNRKTYGEANGGLKGSALDKAYSNWLGVITSRVSKTVNVLLASDIIRITRLSVNGKQTGGSLLYRFTKKLFNTKGETVDVSLCTEQERADIMKTVKAAQARCATINVEAKPVIDAAKKIADAKSN